MAERNWNKEMIFYKFRIEEFSASIMKKQLAGAPQSEIDEIQGLLNEYLVYYKVAADQVEKGN